MVAPRHFDEPHFTENHFNETHPVSNTPSDLIPLPTTMVPGANVRPTAVPPQQPVRRRRRFDAETKRVKTAQAREMLAAGRRWCDIAQELNVLEGSLRKWVSDYENATQGAVVTRAVDAVKAAKTDDADGGELSITTPDGYTVNGLNVEDAYLLIDLLRGEATIAGAEAAE